MTQKKDYFSILQERVVSVYSSSSATIAAPTPSIQPEQHAQQHNNPNVTTCIIKITNENIYNN
jgi:hypothetical protein